MKRFLMTLLLLPAFTIGGTPFESADIPAPFGTGENVYGYCSHLPGRKSFLTQCGILMLQDLPELTAFHTAVLLRRPDWGAALRFRTFGWELWRENSYILDFAYSPFRGMSAGIRIKLLTLQGWGISARYTVSLDLDCLIDLGAGFHFRTAARNVNEPLLGKESLSRIPLELEIGLEWRPIRWLAPGVSFLNTATERDAAPVFHVRIGTPELHFDISLDPSPLTVSFRAGLKLGRTGYESGLVVRTGIPAIGYGATVTFRISEKSSQPATERALNVNSAYAAALMRLPGIKPSMVRRIIRYRSLYGSFRRLHDLCRIPGITPGILEKWKGRVVLDDSGSLSLPLREGRGKNGFDINNAEIRDFHARGIDPESARKIILFREKLGGFSTLGELGLVRGIPSSVLKRIGRIYAR